MKEDKRKFNWADRGIGGDLGTVEVGLSVSLGIPSMGREEQEEREALRAQLSRSTRCC